MELTRGFAHISKADVALAGGKGASLGEMTRAQIPVPPGFVVLSSAFERFLDEEQIRADIEAILENVRHENTESIERASEEIHAIITSRAMPQDLQQDIEKQFDALHAEFVAVRSSATAEDSASAAWAGQLETYLNTPKEKLFDNVRRCWASLFTPRAIFYRLEKGLRATHISVAVVVQKMIQSDVAGVAFSVHPVTQDRQQLIIEGALGLGEAVVSGQVTPDSFVVHKTTWELVEKYISSQDRMLVRDGNEGNAWKECGAKGSAQKISDEQVIELAKLVVHIEEHYGFPVDVEWALHDGKFFITQSRPITTLETTK